MARGRGAWLLALLFLGISLPLTAYGRYERAGWLLLTAPGDRTDDEQVILGSAVLHDGRPVMYENWSSVQQVAFFSGLESARRGQDYFLLRPVYSLLATLAAPLTGVLPALLLVNWLAWACCVWMAWRLTIRLSGDPLAAAIAAALAIAGIGMVVHIGDYSAHLLSFAVYFAGVCLLWESRVLVEPRPWSTHLSLAAFFAVAVLVYNTGVMLVAVYVLSSLRHNAWTKVAAGAAFALAARPAWQVWLRLMGVHVADAERLVLRTSVREWLHVLSLGVVPAVLRTPRLLTEFFLFDSPLVVVGGVLAFALLSRGAPQRWFGAVVLAIPIVSVFPFAMYATARGYVVYGASIWLYCWIGVALARGLRAPRLRPAAALALVAVVSTHVAWSTAHLWGWLGPVKSYFLGWDQARTYLFHARPAVVSMTGREPAAILFGGDASLVSAGALVTGAYTPVGPDAVSLVRALAARSAILLAVAVLGAMVMKTARARILAVAAVAAVAIGSAVMSAATFRSLPRSFEVATALELAPGARLSYRVALSPRFGEELVRLTEASDEVVLKLLPNDWNSVDLRGHAWEDVRVSATAGDTALALDRKAVFWRIAGGPEAAAALRRAGRLEIDLANLSRRTVNVPGWQRVGLPEREAILRGPGGAPAQAPRALPAFEVRVIRPDGSLKAVGF